MVRLSGPGVLEALDRLSPARRLSDSEPRVLRRITLRTPQGQVLDDAMAVIFKAQASYTGEDSAELHIHGSAVVATRVLEALREQGIRQALPGEFSFRAVRNGKMSVSQAEAVADLISASNESAADLALEKMAGSQGVLLGQLAESLRQLATLGEAGIDFSDQDIEEISLPALRQRLAPIQEALEKLEGSYERGSKVQEGLRVAFIGLPNAGKSSFFNALLGEDRSIVSELAGTTRDVVRERLSLRGQRGSVTLRLEDTAGLRSTEDRIEKLGVERSLRAAREAELILLIWDTSLSGEAAQAGLRDLKTSWKALGEPVSRTLGVLTQGDRESSQSKPPEDLGIPWVGPTSAVTGQGIQEAARNIADFCEKWVHRDPGEVLLTRLDQQRAVARAREDLARAAVAPELDLFAADLRQGLQALAPLIGETLPDDILGRIFSQFCIGK